MTGSGAARKEKLGRTRTVIDRLPAPTKISPSGTAALSFTRPKKFRVNITAFIFFCCHPASVIFVTIRVVGGSQGNALMSKEIPPNKAI